MPPSSSRGEWEEGTAGADELPQTQVSASPCCAKGPRMLLGQAESSEQPHANRNGPQPGAPTSFPAAGAGLCGRPSALQQLRMPRGRYRAPITRSAGPRQPRTTPRRKHGCAALGRLIRASRYGDAGRDEGTHGTIESKPRLHTGPPGLGPGLRCPPRSGPRTRRCSRHRPAPRGPPGDVLPAPLRRAPSCPRSAAACCRCCTAPRGTRSGMCS